ncbi:protein subunit release factor B [Streptomyces sp. V4I8]
MEDMSGPYAIRGSVSLPEAELLWRFSRSSGPGGQHVNTSDSQVELRFDLASTEALPEVWKQRALERLASRLVDGVISVRASEHRSQWRNRETADRTPRRAPGRGDGPAAQAPQADPHSPRDQRAPSEGEEAALGDQAGTVRAGLGLDERGMAPTGAMAPSGGVVIVGRWVERL